MLPSAVHRVAASGPIKSAIGIIASNELKHTTTIIRKHYDKVGASSARMAQRTVALVRYGDRIVQQVKALENPPVPRHGEPVPYVPPTPWCVRRAIEEGPRAVREMRPYMIPRRA